MTRIFVITTRGVESISAEELAALSNVTVDEIAYRRVFASSHGSLAPLLSLRTVDDVFIYVATWSEIDRTRETLSRLRIASAELDLKTALSASQQIRPIPRPPIFSVTTNFVGKRNYNTGEIKQACAEGIAEHYGWSYSENDEQANLNVRVFIEGDIAVVGARLGARSLSKRPYKQQHVLGSLKPAVAAALLWQAAVAPGTRILDPCCGAGTILIEAKSYGALAYGGDIHWEAVSAAHFNTKQAGVTIPLQYWDARALPLSDRSMDRVVSNLPWGRAVSIDTPLSMLYQEMGEEIERVLIPGGKAVLLTNRPDLVRFEQLKCDQQIEISLFGQTPTLMVWSDSD